MKKKIKDEWVAALRGGKYEQGREVLHIDNKYCCLGVLCDLAEKEGVGRWEEHLESDGWSDFPLAKYFVDKTEDHHAKSKTSLTTDVQVWSGINTGEGMVRIAPEDFKPQYHYHGYSLSLHTSLVIMNDNGATFTEIADFIEKHWESL